MEFKEWFLIEYQKDSGKSKRLQVGFKDEKPQWAAGSVTMWMKKK